MKDLTDEQIMTLVNNDNLHLMHYLFDRYYTRIYSYCLKMTKHKTVSEDIAQETFYKIIKYRASFNNQTFSAWSYTIARNLCNDHFKNIKNDRIDLRPFKDTIDNESSHTIEEDIAHLNVALKMLSDNERELVILSRYQKLKYKEIALIMSTTEGAVKTRIHRALHKLKAYYFQNTATP